MSRTRRPAEKSPSEKLRATFFKHYTKEKSPLEFDEYYKNKMQLLIDHYEKLLNK